MRQQLRPFPPARSQTEACGLQAIIGNYAVPILENRQVWGTSDETATAYLDTRDVAKMALAALRPVILAACLALTPLFCSPSLSQHVDWGLTQLRCGTMSHKHVQPPRLAFMCKAVVPGRIHSPPGHLRDHECGCSCLQGPLNMCNPLGLCVVPVRHAPVTRKPDWRLMRFPGCTHAGLPCNPVLLQIYISFWYFTGHEHYRYFHEC